MIWSTARPQLTPGYLAHFFPSAVARERGTIFAFCFHFVIFKGGGTVVFLIRKQRSFCESHNVYKLMLLKK